MGEICLSVAPILRCQSLTRTEAGVLLLPPGFEIIFAIVLLWVKRGSDKKHVFIAAEVFVYFSLAVLDLLTHTIPTLGTSLNSFRSLDIVIGVASFIPIFLYMFSLYLLTATDLVPSLPIRFQSMSKYVLLAFFPLVILLNELGSFIGITYRSFQSVNGPILGVGFTNASAEMFISSVTLVLLTAFQATNFCIAFYRLVKAFSHQRTLETENREREKEMETHLFRGLGWIVVGMKLGAIETVIGFAQGGFGIALTRRIFRMLGHACLIIGLIKGIDTVEDFQLYSPGQAQKHRKSMLRAMIQNPRFSTFRHVGGHDFDKETPFDERHQSVIRLGDPSWMRRDIRKPTPVDEERATAGFFSSRKSPSIMFQLASSPSPSRNVTSSARDSVSSTGSFKRTSWPYTRSPMEYYEDITEISIPEGTAVPPFPRPLRTSRQRVTVHIRHDRLPVLELRRFSNLHFPGLIQDPFRDPRMRARSLPGNLESDHPPDNHTSASFTRHVGAHSPLPVPALPTAAAVPRAASVSESITSHRTHQASASSPKSQDHAWSRATHPGITISNANDASLSSSPSNPRLSTISTNSRPPSTMSFNAIGSPNSTIMSFESPGSRAAPRFARISRRDRGLSSSTTASEVHALALQFPGIPARGIATPARRSMLSHEMTATEPEPEPEPDTETPPEVARVPSAKRKPAPLVTRGLVDEKIRGVEIEQVVDEDVAVRSLPTPTSAPRTQRHLLLPHTASRVADVPSTPTPSDQGSFNSSSAASNEIPIVRSASLVKRSMEQGKLVRVKSVGHAPVRAVSVARCRAVARGSIQVELGHVVRGGRAVDVEGTSDQGEDVDAVSYSVVAQ